ncbi:hypothetical protein BD309DRAFT_123820 [Dichomitus squalens]|nr:hypothetical protein BD309DRAFT_123820 [Dichomitus squalens]
MYRCRHGERTGLGSLARGRMDGAQRSGGSVPGSSGICSGAESSPRSCCDAVQDANGQAQTRVRELARAPKCELSSSGSMMTWVLRIAVWRSRRSTRNDSGQGRADARPRSSAFIRRAIMARATKRTYVQHARPSGARSHKRAKLPRLPLKRSSERTLAEHSRELACGQELARERHDARLHDCTVRYDVRASNRPAVRWGCRTYDQATCQKRERKVLIGMHARHSAYAPVLTALGIRVRAARNTYKCIVTCP